MIYVYYIIPYYIPSSLSSKTPFYQCISDHFEEFERVYDERYERQYGFRDKRSAHDARKSFNWKEFDALLKRYPLPKPRIIKSYKWIYSASL